MKIAMITGSFPPAVCGVGYYTDSLTEALRAAGASVEVIMPGSWHLSDIRSILRSIDSVQPDVIHVQYPTIGYGASLVPQMISLARPCVVTLHELSQAHILRKLALMPFSLRSRHIVFTTPYEEAYAVRRAPWIKGRSSVIPIGCNIIIKNKSVVPLCPVIIHFGIIRPNKGIEDVIHLAELIKQSSLDLSIRIIGKSHADHAAYAVSLKQRAMGLPVTWHLDLPDDRIEGLLSEACIAYQPYPDGASDRRSSLIAVLQGDIAAITTKGGHMPDDLAAAVEIADSPSFALSSIQRLLADRGQLQVLTQKGRAYSAKFAWSSIAKEHLALYQNITQIPRQWTNRNSHGTGGGSSVKGTS